jgi:hypothetical protein
MRNDAVRTVGIASILNLQEPACVMMERGKRKVQKEQLSPDIAHLDPLAFCLLNQGKKIGDLTLFLIS